MSHNIVLYVEKRLGGPSKDLRALYLYSKDMVVAIARKNFAVLITVDASAYVILQPNKPLAFLYGFLF